MVRVANLDWDPYERVIALWADRPGVDLIGLRIPAGLQPLAVCTSSGTVGHSVSFGKADAVVIISPSATLADAAATAIGNKVKKENDIASGLESAQNIEGVTGIIIIKGDKMGSWGNLKLCSTVTDPENHE